MATRESNALRIFKVMIQPHCLGCRLIIGLHFSHLDRTCNLNPNITCEDSEDYHYGLDSVYPLGQWTNWDKFTNTLGNEVWHTPWRSNNVAVVQFGAAGSFESISYSPVSLFLLSFPLFSVIHIKNTVSSMIERSLQSPRFLLPSCLWGSFPLIFPVII